MPPRYAYWTILIDQRPTAFRARKQEDLLPTLAQLRRKNAEVVMKWFARGRLWESPDQAERALKDRRNQQRVHRGREWRPGGEHRDPRERFRTRPGSRRGRERDREPTAEDRRPAGPKPGRARRLRKPRP